jgi:hypothetical protein
MAAFPRYSLESLPTYRTATKSKFYVSPEGLNISCDVLRPHGIKNVLTGEHCQDISNSLSFTFITR